MPNRKLLADHATHGKAGEVHGADTSESDQGRGVIGELLNTVRRGGHLRLTVTACVIPQYPKRIEQRRQLRLPHTEVGHQTV